MCPTIERVPKKIADLVGWTLIAIGGVLALIVPVVNPADGFQACPGPGVLGAFGYEERFEVYGCTGLAASRVYNVVPFIVIGVACLIAGRKIFNSANTGSARPTDSNSHPTSSSHAAPAQIVDDAGATTEASLRLLKALHDDGVLTDDEYETKRKVLANQL